MTNNTVKIPAREIKVIREADVLVAGGGYAGVGAALTAAKEGMKTILVEQLSCLGGLVTMGFVALTFSYVEAYGLDIFHELKKANAIAGRFVDPEITKHVLEKMLLDAGVEILYCTTVTDALVENGTITGAVIFNKSGYSAIKAKRCIDASGDGDLAAYAGVPFESGSPEHNGYNNSASLVCRIGNVDMKAYMNGARRFEGDTLRLFITEKIEEAIKNGDLPYMIDTRFNWVVKIPGRDDKHQEVAICYAHSRNCRCLDQFDLTRMYIEGRQQNGLFISFLRKYIPGFENSWLIDTAPLLGVRESRRIMCEYKITGEDLVENRQHPDVITRDFHIIDIHNPTEPGHTQYVNYPVPGGGTERRFVKPGSYREIPYRALVAQKIDNLLIAGRNISSTFEGQAGTRLVMACFNMGQASGMAAAVSIRDGLTPRRINVRKLQKELIRIGIGLGDKPEFGLGQVATDEKVSDTDVTAPDKDDKFYKYHSPNLVLVSNKRKVADEKLIDKKITERLQGYTNTGGDVGVSEEGE